jgi:hypothetical protein
MDEYIKKQAEKLVLMQESNEKIIREALVTMDKLKFDTLTEIEFKNLIKHLKSVSKECLTLYSHYKKLLKGVKKGLNTQ